MQQILTYLNLSISLTALLTFLESLSCDGIIDVIDLTRDTTMESKEQIRFKLHARRGRSINSNRQNVTTEFTIVTFFESVYQIYFFRTTQPAFVLFYFLIFQYFSSYFFAKK